MPISKGNNNIYTRYPIRSSYTRGKRLQLAVLASFWMNYEPHSLLPMSKQIEHYTSALFSVQLRGAEMTFYSAANPFLSSVRAKLATESGLSHTTVKVPAHIRFTNKQQ